MESITSRIKQTSQLVRAPEHLKSRIMESVTNPATIRDSNEAGVLPRLSPYRSIIRIRRLTFVTTLCLVLIATGSSLIYTSTTDNPLLSSADSIISNSTSHSTNTELWDDTAVIINQLQTVSDLVYTDTVSLNGIL